MTKVVIFGGGTMGAGIAYAFALKEFDVWVVDPFDAGRESCRRTADRVAARAQERGLLSESGASDLLGRIDIVRSVEEAPTGAHLVVEAVPEDLTLKKHVLALAETLRPVYLASNTSSISISSLAADLQEPETFFGMHFFNPVWSSPLIEIVVGELTLEPTVAAALDLVAILGKEAITVRDSPGFATSRLGVALGLEAIRMLSEGVASAADIDKAMELGYRHPMGPLRLTDLVGLDVRLGIARNLAQEYGQRFEPPQLLVDMVERGDLGKKSGRGFFVW